jgi:tripartite-type tricarboxylate transporter receptor subunit TctC
MSLGPLVPRLLAALLITCTCAAASGWEPSRPIELVVPAGVDGGADQMARFIQAVVAKHGLAKQPIVVVNLPGDAGAEGFLDVKEDSGNAHKLIITLSNLFTTPLATGVPFNWRDLTPLQMLALDQFVLWVHEASPHQSARGWFDALRSGAPGSMRMGGTGARQEDRLVTLMFEKAAGRRIAYLPFKGGGEVVVQLVARG